MPCSIGGKPTFQATPRMVRPTVTGLLVGLVVLLTASAVHGQSTDLIVHVSAEGRPVSGASVTLEMGATSMRSTATDVAGVARFLGIAPGTYRLRVEVLGYRTHAEAGVEVAAGKTRIVDVVLQGAPLALEGITVRVGRIQIQRENTDFGTTVGARALKLLPVPYDPAELVALTPGARAEHVWGGANFQANSYQIDGLSANHPGLGGSLIQPSALWVDRVEVRGLGAGAEFGGFQGGQVNLVTKSGSNEFSAMLRSTITTDALTGSNLVSSEIGSEVKDRYDFEGEVRGALVPDRLFYYLGGTYVDRSARFLNHVDFEGRYSPELEQRSEQKVLGKLTWTPNAHDEIEVSGAFVGTDADHYGMTGYEGPGASSRYTSPTWFGGLAWRRALGTRAVLEARVNRFSRDERTDAYGGADLPGIQIFSLTPPLTSFANAPISRRSAPSSTSATVATSIHFQTGQQEHLLKIGGEYSRGSFLDLKTRNGGMTWMPLLQDGLDPTAPSTWAHPDEGFIPTQWGGDVHLDAEVTNAAAFAQASLSMGRLMILPGIRWARWEGWLRSESGARVEGVQDQAFDPRIGATLQLDVAGSWILKGHWGRYHQNLITQMFDRVGGSDVFSNQEIWYYRGPPLSDPTHRFSEAERDELAAQGLFTRESVITLNETGPVVDYHQPYVDQGLVGLQKQFGDAVRFEALYTRRSNREMVALVDRNRASNYTVYRRVRVHMGGGGPLPFTGGSTYIHELYVPNSAVLEELRLCADDPGQCALPSGWSLADSLSLTWNPDNVLTNAPDARRDFGQVQLSFTFDRPAWGGQLSAVFTDLTGNLDNVSSYADPAEYSPGPYVRVNEGVNSFGSLPNFADQEVKASFWGLLPGGLRGGAFFTMRSGDHFGPQFRVVSNPSLYKYFANVGSSVQCSPNVPIDQCPILNVGDRLPTSFLAAIEGNDVFVGPRGGPHLTRSTTLDLRLERVFELRRFDVGVALDFFNALGSDVVTEVQTLVNHGERYFYFFDDISTPFKRAWAGKWYKSPLARVSPRALRLGMTVYF